MSAIPEPPAPTPPTARSVGAVSAPLPAGSPSVDPPPAGAQAVDVGGAERLAATGAVLVDVRLQTERDAAHIPGAVHLPLDQLQQHGAQVLAGDAPVVTVCGSGRRAQQAAQLLTEAGRSASWLEGGLQAWTAAGRPLTTGSGMSAADWDARYAGTDLVWTSEPNRFLVEEASALTPGTALDLACGEGRNTVWLARDGWRATGVDFSANALGKAEGLARAAGVEVDWVHADVLTWHPQPPAGRDQAVFDLVVLAYLQVPAPDRRRAVATATTATAPGGSLLVIAHDATNLTHGVGGPRHPDVLWTPDEIQPAGFTTLRRGVSPRPTGAGDALDTVVHLRRNT